jgi:endonuclease/exonuclease/phosphatase family metal-dependent hydrolase
MRLRRVTATLGLLTAAAYLPAIVSAEAKAPATPHGAHLVGATATTLTVALPASRGATHYKLFASTTRSKVYVVNIKKAKAATSKHPKIRMTGLPRTKAPIYYRVEALNKKSHKWDPTIHVAGLKLSTPTSVRAHTSDEGLYLTWGGAKGSGFRIQQATNAAMTENAHTWSIRGTTQQFTPYNLVKGKTYWFRVATLNQGTRSSWSSVVRATSHVWDQDVKVMTYNVLQDSFAGTKESGQTVPSWSRRQPAAVTLIKSASPDIISVQEASSFIGRPAGFGGTRQIDALVKALPGYRLARTEIPPTEHYWFRTGVYLVYRAAAWTPIGKGGHWTLPDKRYAAYQVFENRSTGARFLAVGTHTIAGNGAKWDTRRQVEVKQLLADATSYASRQHVPVVYAGDFNSDVNANHAFDAPALLMSARGIADARNAAQALANDRYNSANQYLRTPPAASQSIDYVWASPAVGVVSRAIVIKLSHSKFAGVMPSDHNPVVARVTIPFTSQPQS